MATPATSGQARLWGFAVLNWNVREHALARAVAGCAIAGYAKAGVGYVTEWPASTECSDIQPVTMKCAIAGYAIAGYAVAGWRLCACTEDFWLEQDQSNFDMPLNECPDD